MLCMSVFLNESWEKGRFEGKVLLFNIKIPCALLDTEATCFDMPPSYFFFKINESYTDPSAAIALY